MSCVEQTKGKYVKKNPDGSFKRKGPPYPANECCGQTKKGHDGLIYKSVPNKKGVCRWVKHDVKKKSPKKKPAKKSPKYKLVSDNMCGKMPKTLKMKKLTKVCVEVLSGTNKGKHKWVTQSAAEKGLGGPIPVKWLREHAAKHYEDRKKPAKKSPKKKPAKKSPKKNKMSCEKQTTKKYTSRKGPPYPATACCGEKMEGNDGNMYESVASGTNRAGWKVCRWKKMKSDKPKKPAKKSPKKKKLKTPSKPKPKKRKPAFFEVVSIDDHYNKPNSWMKEEEINKYIENTNKITGDILFIGTSYHSRPKYGIVVVGPGGGPGKLFEYTEEFYYSEALEYANSFEELCKEFKGIMFGKNPFSNGFELDENALEGLFKWHYNYR